MIDRPTLWIRLLAAAILCLAFLACDSSSNSSGTTPPVEDGFQDVASDPAVDVGRDTTQPDIADVEEPEDTEPDEDADAPGDAADAEDVEPDDGDADSCEPFVLELKPFGGAVANMLLVVDRSRSMSGARWTQMKMALREVTARLGDRVRFGLMLFPSPLDFDQCSTGAVVVTPEINNAEAIASGLDLWEPDGGTPTALTLAHAGDELRALDPEGSNWVLLATDGGPGCNLDLGPGCRCIPNASCQDMPGNCLDDERTINAVRALRARGMKTLVVGIPGTEEVRDVLDAMAVEGGTDIDGGHVVVDDLDRLVAELSGTVGNVVPCEFIFRNAPDDLGGVAMRIDGERIRRDRQHRDGWDLADDLLVFYGSACDSLRDGQAHRIEAEGICE